MIIDSASNEWESKFCVQLILPHFYLFTAAGLVSMPRGETPRHGETPRPDVDDTNLWESNEIEILRNVFKEARTQNKHMKAELKTHHEHVEKLDRKCRRQSDELKKRTNKLREARKANERLQILNTSLRQQLDAANATIEFLHTEINELREKQATLSRESQTLRLEHDRGRIDAQNARLDLISEHQSAVRDLDLREKKLKHAHKREVEELRKQVEELREELEAERTRHDRSLRGLQHLRNHFSSVPLEQNTSKANVVCGPQLQKLAL